MHRSRILGITLVVLLSLATPVHAMTVGIGPGDSMVYRYGIVSTYATPNGNVTSKLSTLEQVSVLSVNLNASVGAVGYTLTLLNVNGTAQTNTNSASNLSSFSASNFTTVFDPYDNLTYLGNIGFWPFVYTDLKAGSAENVAINATYLNETSGEYWNAVQYANATVARGSGLININLTLMSTLKPGPAGATVSYFRMNYNATTGVLENLLEKSFPFSIVEDIFTYKLVSFTQPTTPNFWYVPYLVGGAIAVIVAVEVLRRKSAADRKTGRMREKFARAY